MGTVHDLIRTSGKEAALKAAVDREAVEAAAGYLADEGSSISTIYAGWCMANLPHKRLADDAVWQVDGDQIGLVIEPGRRYVPGKPALPIGVPYGSRARLILFYLQSEALRTQGVEIRLGKTLRAWMVRMGVSTGGTAFAMVRDQAERISRCRLSFHIRRGIGVGLVNETIMREAMFLPAEEGRGDLFVETARLSDGFFQHLKKHPVPIEEAAVSQIANNSMALDVYVWLAYRLHVLTKPTAVSWRALKVQFGPGVGRMTDFRRMFLKSLALAVAVYPDALVDVEDAGLILHPSRPPVAPKQQLGVG